MPRKPKLHVSHYLSRVSAFLDRQPLPRVLMTGVVLGLGLGADRIFKRDFSAPLPVAVRRLEQ